MNNPIATLHSLGQSLWYDNIRRGALKSGELAQLIASEQIRGVTSNPTIFYQAFSRSTDYDDAFLPLNAAGLDTEEIFTRLAIEDVQAVADMFCTLYEQSKGGDGYVSLEVSPLLAHSTLKTVEEAKRLWNLVKRPNLLVKIPATVEGVGAIEQCIALGININVTLIFSIQRYREVTEAYLRGLETRLEQGLPINGTASVASFFVSRVDTKVDQRLQALIEEDPAKKMSVSALLGKAAIAQAKLAYKVFQEYFEDKRFIRLAQHGAHVQRPLWASTGTKNPAYRDVVYVEELIGPQTVNTVPPQTLAAFGDHGVARTTITQSVDQASHDLGRLEELGISLDQISQELELEGVKAFEDAYRAILQLIHERGEKTKTA